MGAATTKVMRSLKAYINRYGEAPTPAELAHFMFIGGVIKRDDPNYTRPRLTELVIGKIQHQAGGRVRIGGGECEYLPLRYCSVTGNKAHPVRPREKGSVLR